MEKTVYYIDNSLPDAPSQLSLSLSACLENMQKSWQELVILCIGSDRITGDCLDLSADKSSPGSVPAAVSSMARFPIPSMR